MRENGLQPSVIRAGRANLFLSDVFIHSFVNNTGVAVELYDCDGSVGAAIGAGIGAKIFSNAKEAFAYAKRLQYVEPTHKNMYENLYAEWLSLLQKSMKH